MAAKPVFEAWVKGDPRKEVLGDCPFCHRALLTLEEKKVPYETHYIDLANKPEWLFKINPKGSVPAVKDLEEDKWFTDSADIVNHVEDKFPEPQLGKADSAPDVGSKIFPTFVKLLPATGDEEQELKSQLLKELDSLSTHLKSSGPFLKGAKVSAGDLSLGPKLYHVLTALKYFKGFELPADYQPVADYLEHLKSRDSWKNTYYSKEAVIAGWKQHMEG